MDDKQLLIIRQSSLKLSLEWAEKCDKCLSLVELVTLSEVITDYVTQGPQKQILDRVRKVDGHFGTDMPKKE